MNDVEHLFALRVVRCERQKRDSHYWKIGAWLCWVTPSPEPGWGPRFSTYYPVNTLEEATIRGQRYTREGLLWMREYYPEVTIETWEFQPIGVADIKPAQNRLRKLLDPWSD